MALTPGTRLGPYEVTAQIGVGGMGEVYKATDTNLKRAVAIKVLPASVAADVERLARFQREAEVLASLNHPNIAAIYGLERSGGISGLVMELVEGPTLADRIARGAIPLEEGLPIAKQIAEALEAAHEQGIIHRDLKPANIKVRPDGTVKVLDFGLAKAMEPAGIVSPSVSQSPTITTPAMTQTGMILGTAAYMSPEQARGKPVDRRADIWAFGCVLYEMLAGKQTFAAGETISDAVAAILKNEPDWSALPEDTPGQIRTLLRRCLQKDVQKRLPHIGVARIEIDETLAGVAGGSAAADGSRNPPYRVADPTSRLSRRRERLAWAAMVAIAALAAGALAFTLRPVSPLLETRVDISTPPTTDPFSFAISPDGRRVVFAASEDGRSQLWLRSLDDVTSLPVQGTEGATLPFWSPDGRSMAFFAGGVLKRVELSGGQPQTLAPAANPRGGTWGEEGVILFAALGNGSIQRVLAAGGEIAEVTALATGQFGHRFPQFLPGSRQFLFYASGIQDSNGIYLGSLDGSEVARLTEADTVGRYAPPGWLLFIRQGNLVAQRFDRARGVLTGDPTGVAEDIAVNLDQGNGAFSASAAGPLIIRVGESSPRQLTWFDRDGNTLGVMGASDDTQADVALAPDGRRVAVQRLVQGNSDIWLIDAARTTRFTFAENTDLWPLWAPDGTRIVFARDQGTMDILEKSASGAGTEQLLVKSLVGSPLDWSPDGRFLLYSFNTSVTGLGQDQWVLSMDGDRKPFAFSNTAFNERLGQFSPDGRWVAYQSDESGRYEVYVRPFPGPGGQWQISAVGGITPRWRADGRELFYVAPDSTLMAAPVVANDSAVEPGVPTALFRPRIFAGGTNPIGTRWQYDVAPDGRFLINVETEEARVSPITLILNWNPEAKK